MPHDHPGFEYWDVTKPGFPIGNLQPGLLKCTQTGGSAIGVMTPPQAQPTKHTVAERSIGFKASSQFWFALECTTDAQGVVTCEGVLRGRHVHWFPGHPGETAPGPVQEIRLSAAEMTGWGRREVLVEHGQHCDSFFAAWVVNGASVRCELIVQHILSTIPEYKAARENEAREAEHNPPNEVPIIPWPGPPEPVQPPEPQPGDGS